MGALQMPVSEGNRPCGSLSLKKVPTPDDCPLMPPSSSLPTRRWAMNYVQGSVRVQVAAPGRRSTRQRKDPSVQMKGASQATAFPDPWQGDQGPVY